MAEVTRTPAPQTEVVPGPKREVNAEDVAPPNVGLPGQPIPEPDTGGLVQQPPMPTESLDQPGYEQPPEEPGEPEEPGVTHDPLKDTKSALTKTQQELAETKRLMQAILVGREFGGGQQHAPAPAGPPEWATQKYLPDELPTADPEWPAKYINRQLTVRDVVRQEQEDRKEMESFARSNPDFPEYLEDMRMIAAQYPGVYQGPRAIPALYNMAKERKRTKELEANQNALRDKAMATGAQMARQSANQPFTTPRAGGGSVPGRGPKVPPDFNSWDANKMRDWLKQQGRIVEE